MTSPIFAPRAQRELREAVVWIADDNPAAADALLAAAMAAARRLQARPKLGRVRLERRNDIGFGPFAAFPIFWFTTQRRSRRLSSVSCTSRAICRRCSIFNPHLRRSDRQPAACRSFCQTNLMMQLVSPPSRGGSSPVYCPLIVPCESICPSTRLKL